MKTHIATTAERDKSREPMRPRHPARCWCAECERIDLRRRPPRPSKPKAAK